MPSWAELLVSEAGAERAVSSEQRAASIAELTRRMRRVHRPIT